MKEILTELIDHRVLSRDKARQALMDIASGKFNASQTSAFMTVYMIRSITIEELQGFRDAMLELCVPMTFEQPVMDVCGTGGDGKNTFNISTLASLVVAAAGQPVAKHGNYGVSSVSGSSNMLEYFGYTFTNQADVLKRSLDRANICFMHAPLFHPALKNVAPIRKELGVKTFFNMLGPMVNPSFPKRQLVGVFNLELARQYAYIYQQTDKQFLILYALDGYDEISLTGRIKYFTQEGEYLTEPELMGLQRINAFSIRGGSTVEEAAELFKTILQGNGTREQNSVVAINAAFALHTGNPTLSIADAYHLANEVLVSGKAAIVFKKLLEN